MYYHIGWGVTTKRRLGVRSGRCEVRVDAFNLGTVKRYHPQSSSGVCPVDFEAKPKELTGRSRSVSKDFTEQMKLIYKSYYFYYTGMVRGGGGD